MFDQKPKINIYKQLQNAIYLIIIYKKKINLFSKFSKKVIGFIGKFKKSSKNKQQRKWIKKLAHY